MKILTSSFLAGYVSAAVLSHTSSPSAPDEATLPALSSAATSALPTSSPVRNANHIFNAIRGAMRQWDSTWNHNGMSFFLAEVPEGVQFYHGTSQREAVTGMQWLAFEPEHALMFAGRGPRGGPGKGRRGKHGESPRDNDSEGEEDQRHHRWNGPSPPISPDDLSDHKRRDWHLPPPSEFSDHEHDRVDIPPNPRRGPPGDHRTSRPRPLELEPDQHDEQHILAGQRGPPPKTDLNSTGYLHFYRTLHPLNLLYIDGMSAGKTSKGTLDTQDYVLRLGSNNTQTSPFGESDRARALCNMSRDAWEGKVDGFLRMEGGFEVILCDFSAHLRFERAQVVERDGSSGQEGDSGFRLYRAIADRFHGIGGGRVDVDYTNMVSAFASDMDLFTNDTTLPNELLPRLQNQSTSQLVSLQEAVTRMVIEPARKAMVNWQSIAEMFVQRYATPLQYLVSPGLSDADFELELQTLLRPFASDLANDAALIAQRCVDQFLPPHWQDTLAGQVVQQVGHEICSTLTICFLSITSSTADKEAYISARSDIEQLVT
ncbi:hypothetical protein LTR70_001946 [Exophiala xenobiotica]|uniref:Uncharacterized protein n=1 Tax=Lithohypha guttulata TaxID=1690604 RepID=A0ABR0KA32_9EURO|nr:hypothetical protein LTR24_005383 [Lithohypha guttulata]KAK5326931.1 hypothetical protein LTR70_001946 [Exophiala xenobiotica]